MSTSIITIVGYLSLKTTRYLFITLVSPQSTTLLSRRERSALKTKRWLCSVSSGPERMRDGSFFCAHKNQRDKYQILGQIPTTFILKINKYIFHTLIYCTEIRIQDESIFLEKIVYKITYCYSINESIY